MGDLRKLDDDRRWQDSQNLNEYIQMIPGRIGNFERSRFLNTNPQFRGVLKDIRRGTWDKVQQFFNNKLPGVNIRYFGGNFYKIFWGMKTGAQIPMGYLNEAQSLGEVWERFLEENKGLISKILDFFDKTTISDTGYMQEQRRHIFVPKGYDPLEHWNKGQGTKENLETIGRPLADELNVLLKQAARAMEKLGIDINQFRL